MSATHQDPQLTIVCLDFQKPVEARACLESIRKHILFPHHVAYLHNGQADYPYQLFKDGLIDTFIQTRENGGLGLGTRTLMASVFSPYVFMCQNDQVIARDFEWGEFKDLARVLDTRVGSDEVNDWPARTIKSVSLAGAAHAQGLYSERGHVTKTSFYREMETAGLLGSSGAGPYHSGDWREAQIQRHYRERGYLHYSWRNPLVADKGVWTIRDTGNGRVKMRTDTKQVWWLEKPTRRDVFPDMTPDEWDAAIAGKWDPGSRPEGYVERGESFNCWGDVTHVEGAQ